jgi:hypothetical protein
MMVHIGGVQSLHLMSQILDVLRPGDVLTHCFSGVPKVADEGTNIVQDGKLLSAALEAKRRGVIFDVGHGGGSFDFTVAERMKQVQESIDRYLAALDTADRTQPADLPSKTAHIRDEVAKLRRLTGVTTRARRSATVRTRASTPTCQNP